MGRAGTSCAPQRRSSTPAHDTERCAIRPEAGTRPRWRKKRRPSATWRWALQQLIHRGSGSTDSTNSSDPPLLGRRTLPLNCTCDFPVWRGGLRVHTSRFWRFAAPQRARGAWRPGLAARGERRTARRRFAAVGWRAACRRRSVPCVTPARRLSACVGTERTGARLRRRQRRRCACTITDRTAIHVCNTTGCASICSHCLVPVFDASDPLKRRPRATAAARALLACTRHARSAPCCAAQGCTGPDIAAMQRAQRRQRANDSKMKQRGRPRERRTVTALSWRSLALAGAVHRCRRDTDDPLTILRSSPRRHEAHGALRSRPDARRTMHAQRDARRYIAHPGHGRTRVRFVHSFEE